MRIGIVTDPLDTKSSVRVYLRNLIEQLLKISDPDNIYLIHQKSGHNPLYQQANEIILPGLYRDTVPSASLFDVLRPLQLQKYGLDVIHYTHSNPPLTFFASGARSVCLITTIGPVTHPQHYPLASRYMARLARIVNQRMDVVITESEAEKREIVRFLKVSDEKVRVIPSGVDDIFVPLSNREAIEQSLRLRYGIHSPYILTTGAYRPVKNGPGLIKAFAQLKQQGFEHKLVLVGKPAQKFGEVTALIDRLDLKEEVISTGFVSDEDLPKFYGAADLFVLPSFKESFPHVLVEAMACGCPVVTSDVDCMLEMTGDAGIAVAPEDIDGLASAMQRVLADGRLRGIMRKKSVQRARRFSWEQCTRDTLQVYEELYKDKRKAVTS